MEIDHKKIEGIVPNKFHRWLKVFRKVESKRMPVRKVWNHVIDLKKNFKPGKVLSQSLDDLGIITSGCVPIIT